MFLVLSLPRSRSAWLSHFLTCGGVFLVGHDLLLDCDSLEDFEAFFQEGSKFEGSCETGAVLGWRLLRQRLPKVKLLVVHRPVLEVAASLVRQGVLPDIRMLEEREGMLQTAGRAPGIEAIEYSDLDDLDCMKWMTEYLLGPGWWELEWWLGLRQYNIQVNMKERLERLQERDRAMRGLAAEVAKRTREMEGAAEWMN